MPRILAVDDDPAITMLIRAVLGRQGHEVRMAMSAEQAIARFAQQPFDLVITDRCLGDDDGFALLRTLREKAPTIPAILMTAHPEAFQKDLAIQGYLAKPFPSLDTIRTTVERVLHMRSLRAA